MYEWPRCNDVQAYPDESQRPEMGEGLNKRAEVTLHKVYRMDKESGKPTADKERIDKFVGKLKKLAADQGSRFISYNPDGGVWRFEVEHFSRCARALSRLLTCTAFLSSA